MWSHQCQALRCFLKYFVLCDSGPAYRAGVSQAAQAGLSSDQRAKDVFGSMSYQLGLGWTRELSGLWQLILSRRYGYARALSKG